MRAAMLGLVCAVMVACAQMPSGDLQPGQRPGLETTEAGLWMRLDMVEERLKVSGRVVQDEKLDACLKDIVCRLEPDHCPNIRIYVVDVPYFNASMAPNGMMQVWTGLLLRTENEAQLAFVLGHELAHYVRRHSLQRWVDMQNKANAASIFSILTGAVGVGYVGYMGEMAAMASALAFSRDQEREADELGTARVVEAGYDPREAVRIWQALKNEKSASKKKESSVFFSTHPGIDERIENLASTSASARADVDRLMVSEGRLKEVVAGYRDEWLGDELTRAEYAESEVLFRRLIERSDQQGLLLFYLGELYRKRGGAGDLERAIEAYRLALEQPDVPARTHRGLGQSLIRLNRDEEAHVALEKYLAAAPDASDRQMIEHQIQRLR